MCWMKVCGAVALFSVAAHAQRPGHDAFAPWMHERVGSVLKVLDDHGDLAAARSQLRDLFGAAAAYAPPAGTTGLTEADLWLRLVERLGNAPERLRRPLLTYLRANPALAAELAMTLEPDDDDAQAFDVLSRVIQKDAEAAGRHPALTAALCVVYDRPHPAAATRGKVLKGELIDPVAIFEYFIQNEGRLLFPPETLPPQVLVYLVDTTATPSELAWALNDHAGDRNVGKRYFDITYDTASFKYNQPAKISKLPYTLQNIRKVGGVCAEQAYYAAHVAKAIGVPAAEISGRSSTDGHAWVGFLQQRGGGLAWNLDEGHYDEYEKLRGDVSDPQSGRSISDDELALTADLCGVSATTRHTAVALADAARFVLRAKEWPPPRPQGMPGGLDAARRAGTPGALELLARAETLTPCLPLVWNSVREAAPKMDAAAREEWFGRLSATCGRKYPSFAYSVLTQIIAGMPDVPAQAAAWQWAFSEYRMRADLAGNAKIREGKLWEGAGDPARAYDAYSEVARTFPNDGTVAVEALAAAEAMLKKHHRESAAIDMYADAFRRISRPSSTSANFFAASNYYRVGERYATLLESAGRTGDAGNVRRLIDRGVEKK